jgi:predicted O-methyltransferase YrrM
MRDEDFRKLSMEVVSNLKVFTRLDCIWKRGLVNRGGPHYRLSGMLSPISIGVDECVIFGRLIKTFKPKNCFIIGNAFGMSSVYIAKVMERFGGNAVVTLDNKSEGDGELCFQIAAALCNRMGAKILKNKVGSSPEGVHATADDVEYDLIFIDGLHSHPQVTKDFEAVKHLVHDHTIICWHDYWIPGILESVKTAEHAGFLCLKIRSSCEMVFGTKNPKVYSKLKQLYPNSEKPRGRRLGLVPFKLPYAYLKFLTLRYVLGRKPVFCAGQGDIREGDSERGLNIP